MINHARNLLMNVSGNDYTRIGEELIDPLFVPKTSLPSAIVNIRRVLFGATPDGEMLNYRCAQFLRLLHCCELGAYVTALDSRITYDLTDAQLFQESLFTPAITVLDTDGATLAISGGSTPPSDASGRLCNVHTVELQSVAAGPVATVYTELTRTHPVRSQTDTLSVSAGSASELFTLVGSGIRTRLFWPSGTPLTQTTGMWRIVSRSRPVYGPATLESALKNMGEALVDIFSRGSSRGHTEPFSTFYELWSKHRFAEYRLGGLLLALIYQMDLLP